MGLYLNKHLRYFNFLSLFVIFLLIMPSFAGTWTRYKVENEEAQMNYIGAGALYEVMKPHVPVMVITEKSADTHLENYTRGDWKQEYLVNVGGESNFNMGDGTTAKVYPKYANAEKTSVVYEFDHKGIHHKYTRTINGDELEDICDYDNGKCIAKHYFKRE